MKEHMPSAIQQEVRQLIDRQIETLQQRKPLSPSDLLEYHARARKIAGLYGELDRTVRTGGFPFWPGQNRIATEED